MIEKVSCVIPALNEEQFIGECLKSLRNQTYPLYEIIVVDGGSTDRTVDIAKKFADKVISVPIRNAALQREIGCKIAKGDFILLADADTVFPPDWVEKAMKYFVNPDVAAVTGDIRPLKPNILSSINCWIRNVLTPHLTQRACSFLFKRPPTDSLFAIDGHISKLDIYPLRRRLTGKVIKAKDLFVYTDVPVEQQFQVVGLFAALSALAICVASFYAS